jgi:hypothetical protein
MAALLAVVSATCLSPVSIFAQSVDSQPVPLIPPATPVDVKPQTTAPEAIKALIDKSEDAKKDVSARILKYVLEGPETPIPTSTAHPDAHFASAAVRGSEARKKEIAPMVDKWVKTSPDVSWLYFVLSVSDTPPGWIKNDPTAAPLFKPGTNDFKACLDSNLSREPHSQLGIIRGTSLMGKSVENFLAAAGAAARGAVTDCNSLRRVTAETSIANHDDGGPNPPMSPKDGSGGQGSGKPDPLASNQVFGFNDLYVDGAKVGNVSNGKDGYRTLSAKMYTTVVNGVVTNQLGIIDITNPGAVYTGAFINLPPQGPVTVTVYGGLPNGSNISRNYVVEDVNGQITISRPGTEDGKGMALKFSETEVANLRTEQVKKQGTTLIDGKPYFVLGQGGPQGSFVFFDAAMNPAYVSDGITIKDSNGSWGRSHTKPNLNAASGDPKDLWHMEWQGGRWTIVAGVGDLPPAPSTSTTTVHGARGSHGRAGRSGDDQQTSGPEPQDCAGGLCEGFDDQYTGRDASADLTDEWKEKVHFLRLKAHPHTFFMIFTGGDDQGGQILTVSDEPNEEGKGQIAGLIGVRGYKNDVVYETDSGNGLMVTYTSLQSMVDGHSKIDGSYMSAKDSVSGVRDVDVLTDMIKVHYVPAVKDESGAAVSNVDDVADKIYARVKGHGFTGNSYVITGSLTNSKRPLKVSGVDGDGKGHEFIVWPGDSVSKDPKPKSGDGKHAKQGAVADLGAGIAGMPLPEAGQELDGVGAIDPRKNASGVGVYQAQQNKGWYLFVEVLRGEDKNSAQTARYGYTLKGLPAQWAASGNEGLQGLDALDPPMSINGVPVPKLVEGSTGSKGVFAFYRVDSSNVKDKNLNCMGPVMWIGLSADEAKAACVKGKL